MLRKTIIFLLFVSLVVSQAAFFTSRQSAATDNSELFEMASMLPESDIVVTMDFDRTLNVAAPNLLNQDAKKIEHLQNLMRTIENQIGINPNEIRQLAAGVKFPATVSKDSIADTEFAVIIRTVNSNANLLETWSKKVDAILKFKDEQAPSRRYMDEFKTYRSFKFVKATPEKIAASTAKFQDALQKTQSINNALNNLPKLTTDAKAVANLRAQNKQLADSIENSLNTLKADSDMKNYRETSVKLLNRWNAITLDDPQRAEKLAAILKESQQIEPAFKQKYENAQKVENIFSVIEPDADENGEKPVNFDDKINSELDKTLDSLGKLPPTKLKKTEELNSLAGDLDSLHSLFENVLEAEAQTPTITENTDALPEKPKSKSFYELLKESEREDNVGGKRMVKIDFDKLDENTPATGEAAPKKEIPDLAIGYLDDKTMVIGFEKTITPFLKRDANYKNQKAIEMLSSTQNSLFAFAVNSTLINKIANEVSKKDKKSEQAKNPESSFWDSFTKDINVYGSVNYDSANVTNDMTLSLGFFKEKVADLSMLTALAQNNPEADTTFDVAGYQLGKDIFYDLLGSFKAIQASLTFKFEKKKVAALVRSTPRIINQIIGENSAPKKTVEKSGKPKSARIDSIPDLFTTPQIYVDLAELFTGKTE